jgi:UDP-glucose 4-epimerase
MGFAHIIKLLKELNDTNELKVVISRCFDATGAAADESIGKDYTPEMLLVLLIPDVAIEKRKTTPFPV